MPCALCHAMQWVAPDENCVITRFLFAFPNGTNVNGGAFPSDSTSEDFEREVRACIEALEKQCVES